LQSPAPPPSPTMHAAAEAWLAHVPVPLFAMVMGTAGLGLAWRKAHEVFGLPSVVGEAILVLATTLFVAVAGLYLLKLARHPEAVRGEFLHPIRANFFPTLSISLLLLAIAAHPHLPGLGHGLWLSGAALHLAFTLRVVGRWLSHRHDIAHVNPAWFIPVVGNVIVPILGVRLGYVELSWFFFSVGMVFWLLLFTIVLYRLIFHEDLPPRLLPTLFIMIAPPAIGFLSYLALTGGHLDSAGRMLLHTGIFIAMVLAAMSLRFRRLPFAVSWWAYTFPLDALALATLQYAGLRPGFGTTVLAGAVLAAATAIVAVVLARTGQAMAHGKLFVPE